MEYLLPEYRLDWFGAGPSSPNKTGSLLAIVFVAAWWPALRFRWGFWLSLPVAFVAAVFMLQTESRGALVAASVGLALLIGGSIFNRLNALNGRLKLGVSFLVRVASCAVLLVVLLFYSQQLGVNDRMAAMTSGEDGSSNVRVALYSAGFQMIAAAPMGWGHGEAGNAYGQWYQEIGDSRSYLSLVNSHLTWMTDYGILFQFVYIAGWFLVLLLCWPFDGHRREEWPPSADAPSIDPTGLWRTGKGSHIRGVSFAAWVTLGICGFFSSVLTLVWLWVIPCLLLALCIIQRLHGKQWTSKRQRLIASAAVLVGFVGLQATGHTLSGGERIAATPDRVEIGDSPKAVALIQPDRQILGEKYGHTLREYLDEAGGFTVLREPMNAVDLAGFETVVLSGGVEFSGLRDFEGTVVWLNPPAGVGEAALEVMEGRSLTVIVGSLGDWRRLRVWESLVDTNPVWDLIQLRGVADFVPGWPRYLNHNPGSENRGHELGAAYERE